MIKRRALSIFIYLAAAVMAYGLAPVWLPAVILLDLFGRTRFAKTRLGLITLAYLFCEMAALPACLLVWLANGGPFGKTNGRYIRQNYAIARWWGGSLYGAAKKLFHLNEAFEDDADARLSEGPVLVFIRHSGMADALIPLEFFQNRLRFQVRSVFKRELLWDPTFDLIGNRTPQYFVNRGSNDPGREVERMAALMDGLGPRDAALIYPEGTRFTEKKKQKALERIEASGNVQLLERARGLNFLLPPKTAGALGMIERNPNVDVIFCAHVGFDNVHGFADMAHGTLIGSTLKLRRWRVSSGEIPKDREGRIAWLYENWKKMDDWVGRQLQEQD